jgi:uncharacterized protein
MSGVMFNEISAENIKTVIDNVIENFKENEKKINNLNVFPVPDGDTGTNMLLTLNSVKEELLKVKDFSAKNVLEKASFGALIGARGNSGVILSQIIKGFFDVFIADDDFSLEVIKEALKSSKDLAYSSVQDPTEGTILTTIKDICNFVESLDYGTHKIKIIDFLDEVIFETERSVERSTFLLPVLKKAGVVDAGAQGLLEIIIGVKKALIEIIGIDGHLGVGEREKVKVLSAAAKRGKGSNKKEQAINNSNGNKKGVLENGMDNLREVKRTYEIKYIYCTQVIIKGSRINVERLREKIESYGDSTMVVGNENVVKIHVHTNYPNKVLKTALREGTIHDIEISNMEDQRQEVVGVEEPEKAKVKARRALLAVVNGDGLEGVFRSIGTDVIVSGGQSMNPSAYDIAKAINSLDASEVIIFPNNKNIIPTANQTKKIIREKDIYIVPTRSIPAGISAILSYNPDAEMEENMINMEEAVRKTKDGEVTQAVRDANLMVGEIKKGEYIGLSDGKIRVIADNVVDATIDLIKDIADTKKEVITFYTGEHIVKEDIENITKRIKEFLPDVDIEIHKGGQPLYPYIFSIE